MFQNFHFLEILIIYLKVDETNKNKFGKLNLALN